MEIRMIKSAITIFLLCFCVSTGVVVAQTTTCGCNEDETNVCQDIDPCSHEFLSMVDECCLIGVKIEDDLAIAGLLAMGSGLAFFALYKSNAPKSDIDHTSL